MPSFILIHPTVWPEYTNIIDRQTGQDSTDRQTTNQQHRAKRFRTAHFAQNCASWMSEARAVKWPCGGGVTRVVDVDGTEVPAHRVRGPGRQQLDGRRQLPGRRLQPGHRVPRGVVQRRSWRTRRPRLLRSSQRPREAAVGRRGGARRGRRRPSDDTDGTRPARRRTLDRRRLGTSSRLAVNSFRLTRRRQVVRHSLGQQSTSGICCMLCNLCTFICALLTVIALLY